MLENSSAYMTIIRLMPRVSTPFTMNTDDLPIVANANSPNEL
jgi:hypothetical protein